MVFPSKKLCFLTELFSSIQCIFSCQKTGMNPDLLYQLALCEVPYVGPVIAKKLVDHFGSAENIFAAPVSSIEAIDEIGPIIARCIKQFKDFRSAETEMKFIERYKIQPLFITDPSYPRRLLNCYDPPTLLFYRGTANL